MKPSRTEAIQAFVRKFHPAAEVQFYGREEAQRLRLGLINESSAAVKGHYLALNGLPNEPISDPGVRCVSGPYKFELDAWKEALITIFDGAVIGGHTLTRAGAEAFLVVLTNNDPRTNEQVAADEAYESAKGGEARLAVAADRRRREANARAVSSWFE